MDMDQVSFLQKHGSGVVPRMEFKIIQQKVAALRKQVDWVIVSLHFGLEYTMYPAPRDIAFCRKLIDCGVDIIVAHHPHYPQGVEKYRHGLIAYSLGNFVWDHNFVGHTTSSFMLKIRLSKDRIAQVKTIPFKMNSNYQLEECRKPDALKKIELLSSVLLDAKEHSNKWYFVSRSVFLNTVKNLFSIPLGADKRRQILNWARTVSSYRVRYTIRCFLLYLVTFRAFVYEFKKMWSKGL
jgi:poly-gamma-glutamate capsule biosynthesis protein CapA/YwtB (metallophosphatase superfamily)